MQWRRPDERGAIAILTALSMVALCVVAGLVVDLGLMRVYQQSDRSTADATAMAGVNGLVPDIGRPSIHPFAGVCQALHYLQVNDPDFGTLVSPQWQDGNGTTLGVDGCSTAQAALTCSPNVPTTWARFVARSQDGDSRVTIQSGYTFVNSGFSEDSQAAYASDTGDASQGGCDQLAVIISQTKNTTLGSPAASTMGTTLRSVARLVIQDGDQAPALLLLEPHNCGVLVVGSSGGGSGSLIHVLGTATIPGTIHTDSDATGTGCGSGSNQQLFQGHQSDGIVAYGASGGSGTITSVASNNGVADNWVSDDTASSMNVYGTTATTEGGAGTQTLPAGRDLVTRAPVDARYRAGVSSAITNNLPLINATSAPAGYTTVACTAAGVANAATLPTTASVYMKCTGGYTLGTGTSPAIIHGQNIILDGYFKSGGIAMPDAQNVYLAGDTSQAINLSTGNAFCIRANGTCSTSGAPSTCSASPTGSYASHANLFIRNGAVNQSGGLLRLCNTTMIVLGGQNTTTNPGCIPSTNGTAPTQTPCSFSGVNSSYGNGQFKVNGGVQDWTAPNAMAVVPATDKPDAYSKNFEDLALWDETWGGTSPSNAYTMSGGSNTRTQGVFMVPNASPFAIKGGGTQSLVNAQYIADSISLTGGAQLKMTVDPNSAVPLPSVQFFMVR